MAGTKLYFHDVASTDTGTLPGATPLTTTTLSKSTSYSGTGGYPTQAMDTTIGTTIPYSVWSNTTLAATTAQTNNFSYRYISPPLAAQTIGDGTASWMMQMDGGTSNATNCVWNGIILYLGIWRPSTGAAVATWTTTATTVHGAQITATASPWTLYGAVGGVAFITSAAALTCQAGDILVMEFGYVVTQTKATSYTVSVYYNSTTEDSTVNPASYLTSPTVLTFQGGATASPPVYSRSSRQAVNRASTY